MRYYILATGPSMSHRLADSLEGRHVGVVNNCYELAPWADFLAATDSAWWRQNEDALNFEGERYTCAPLTQEPDTEMVKRIVAPAIYANTNSGVLALEVAKMKGAKEIVMLGFDFHGSHYFGEYRNGLRNTDIHRRNVHAMQFLTWRMINKGVKVVNCTPGTKLKHFPLGDLEDYL